jgi:glycosyltransferase involved in cell wall biosynthesis
MPKVSVCVQAYNHAPYIAQALDSVLMQETDFDYELIIGEDESSDGTREICIRYAEQHPDRIRLFLRSREDVIYINGRATGRYNFVENLRAARGEYIALLDGDDYWTDPHKLQKQVDLLKTHPDYAMCFHSVLVIDETQQDESRIKTPLGKRDVYRLNDILKGNFISNLSMMFRNQWIDDLPDWYWQMPIGDWPLHILNAQHGDIGYIDEVMGVYRQHPYGFMNQLYKEIDITEFRASILQILHDNHALDERILNHALSDIYLQGGLSKMLEGDVEQARWYWKKAIVANGYNLKAYLFRIFALPGTYPFEIAQRMKRD